MITLDRGTLPKRIKENMVGRLAGETAYWYCTACRQWRTTEIMPVGTITCPICGDEPDWVKRPPTLAYKSRYKQVVDLCAEDSDWRKGYDEVERRHGEFLGEVNSGLPRRTQEAGWRYFQGVWRMVDELADYLLIAQDAPVTDGISAYTERGLQRRYYDPRRRNNVSTLSSLNLPVMADDGGVQLTGQEAVETISFHTASSQPLYDTYFADDFLKGISDPLEYSIAYDFSRGATKRDIERQYGLTEQQVRTKVVHIAKMLKKI